MSTPETDDERTLKLALEERNEAQAKLTNIYRWIERNHPDGFIDSLSYSQNLERVTDSWYDRLERVERERDEAREEVRLLKGILDVLKKEAQ